MGVVVLSLQPLLHASDTVICCLNECGSLTFLIMNLIDVSAKTVYLFLNKLNFLPDNIWGCGAKNEVIQYLPFQHSIIFTMFWII